MFKKFLVILCIGIVVIESFWNFQTVQASTFPYQTTTYRYDAMPVFKAFESGQKIEVAYLPNEKGEKYPLSKELQTIFNAIQENETATVFFDLDITNDEVRKSLTDTINYLNQTPGMHRLKLVIGKDDGRDAPSYTLKIAYAKQRECGAERGVLGCTIGQTIFIDQKSAEQQIQDGNTYSLQRTFQHEFFHILGFKHPHIFTGNVLNKDNQFNSLLEYQSYGELTQEQYTGQMFPGHADWRLEKFNSDFLVWQQYNNYTEFVEENGKVTQVILYHIDSQNNIQDAAVYDYKVQKFIHTLTFQSMTQYDMKDKKHHQMFRGREPFKTRINSNTDTQSEQKNIMLIDQMIFILGSLTLLIFGLRFYFRKKE